MEKLNHVIENNLDIKNPLVSKFDTAIDFNHQLSMTPDNNFIEEYSRMINNDAIKEEDDVCIDYSDEYLSMTLGVPRGADNDLHCAKIKRRVLDKDSVPVDKASKNPT